MAALDKVKVIVIGDSGLLRNMMFSLLVDGNYSDAL
jgi:hypothetical protein